MDNLLNRDLHAAVDRHVLDCKSMVDSAEAMVEWRGKMIHPKFDRSCPVRQTEAYLRVWEIEPSSARICEDVDKVFKALPIIQEARGVSVQGICQRRGNRSGAEQSGVKRERGGKTTKGPPPAAPVRHQHSECAKKNRVTKSEEQHASKPEL